MRFEINNGLLANCFQESDETKVVVPQGVSSIGICAFGDNNKTIKNVVLPDSVTEIDCAAFRNCTGLTRISLPDSLTKIERSAFENCPKLKQVVLPSKISRIEHKTFAKCTNLQNVSLPSGLVTISEEAFYNCENIRSITIPDTVKTIEKGAFGGCKKLSEFIVLGNTGTIDESIFRDYWSDFGYVENGCLIINKNLKIKAFEMPLLNITGRLKQHALLGFLDALSIGEKLSETCKQDYYNYIKRQRKEYFSLIFKYTVLLDILCEQKMLTVYEVNELLTECDKKQRHEIKNRLSEYLNNLPSDEFNEKKVLTEEIKKNWRYAGKGDGTVAVTYYKGKALDITIPDTIEGNTVTEIGHAAFSASPGVKGLSKTERETRKKLKSVIIPESVKIIGSLAFSDCESLGTINIPHNTVKIGNYAFHACKELKSICIPESVKTIGDSAFLGCWSLKYVDFYGKNTAFEDSFNTSNVFSASEKVVIRAYKDSSAWKYAEKHGIKHEEL